jgi:sporulation protein YtfJ
LALVLQLGGSEFNASGSEEGDSQKQQKLPFGGGSGGGVSITPIAFLIVSSTGIKMLHLDESTHLYEKILEAAPQTVEKIQDMFKRNKDQSKNYGGQNPPKQDFDI